MSLQGSLTIRDLIDFFQNDQITTTLLKKYTEEIQKKWLVWQSEDVYGRFRKANTPIRPEDLDYRSNPNLTVRREKQVNGQKQIEEIHL